MPADVAFLGLKARVGLLNFVPTVSAPTQAVAVCQASGDGSTADEPSSPPLGLAVFIRRLSPHTNLTLYNNLSLTH